MAARRKLSKAAESGDERYLVVEGRRWRRSDPGIPPKLRAELVDELMDARRAVAAAKRAASARAEKQARARVQHAKLALNERGERAERGELYWLNPSEAALRKRAAASMRALLSRRGRRSRATSPAADSGGDARTPTICPSDVARIIGGERWRTRMQLVRDVAAQLVERGELRVLQRGREVSLDAVCGPIRLAAG